MQYNVKISAEGKWEIGYVSQSGLSILGYTDSSWEDVCAFVNHLNDTNQDFGAYKIFCDGEEMFIPRNLLTNRPD